MCYLIAAVIAILLWSASFIATKIAYIDFAPMMLGFLRFLIAAVILGAVRIFWRDNSPMPHGKDFKIVALSGFLGITLYFAAENVGVKLTTASNAALIVASYPAITALLEFVIYHQRPTLLKMFGILTAILGVGFITISQHEIDGSQTLYGNLLLIAAGIVWAFYNFAVRSISEKYSPLAITHYQMIFGAIFFLPFVWIEGSTFKVDTLSFGSITSLIYLSIGCSISGYLLYNFGLQKLSASTSISLMNLVPVFGLIWSASILHEIITLQQIFGGLVVIIGVILSTKEFSLKIAVTD